MSEARERRARWTVRKARLGDPDEEDYDLAYWDRIPPDERLDFAFQLSLEQWKMVDPDVESRAGLCRSLARVIRPKR